MQLYFEARVFTEITKHKQK